MSMLIFYVGERAFAVETNAILKVFPLVEANKIASCSDYLVGMLDVSGHAIPILDFCQLLSQRPAAEKLSTRIILVKNPLKDDEPLIGIIGERIQGFLNAKKDEFEPVDLQMTSFPFLTHLYTKGGMMVQYVDLGELYPFLSGDLSHIKLVE